VRRRSPDIDRGSKPCGLGRDCSDAGGRRQAKEFQVRRTARGWMREDLDLLGAEQRLYLRQPGYGTSYVTGKYLLEDLLRERSRQLGDAFSMRRYFDEVNSAGLIPVWASQYTALTAPVGNALLDSIFRESRLRASPAIPADGGTDVALLRG
jgi:hypothetical protein